MGTEPLRFFASNESTFQTADIDQLNIWARAHSHCDRQLPAWLTPNKFSLEPSLFNWWRQIIGRGYPQITNLFKCRGARNARLPDAGFLSEVSLTFFVPAVS